MLGQAECLARHGKRRDAHRHLQQRFAETRHRALLVAHPAGQAAAVDLQRQCHAVVVDRRGVGVLQAQLDQEAYLQAFARKWLDAGDLHRQRVARGEQRAGGE